PKSTYCTVAYVTFFGLYSFAKSNSRGSGTFAIPTCVCCPPLASTLAFVKIRNSVVFPTCASPIMPVCIYLIPSISPIISFRTNYEFYHTDTLPLHTESQASDQF